MKESWIFAGTINLASESPKNPNPQHKDVIAETRESTIYDCQTTGTCLAITSISVKLLSNHAQSTLVTLVSTLSAISVHIYIYIHRQQHKFQIRTLKYAQLLKTQWRWLSGQSGPDLNWLSSKQQFLLGNIDLAFNPQHIEIFGVGKPTERSLDSRELPDAKAPWSGEIAGMRLLIGGFHAKISTLAPVF